MRAGGFLNQLDVRLPIVQAPMAGTSTPKLAAAVTNAGGLGSLGVAAMTAEQASVAIEETRRLTTGPFNVNVFCHTAQPRDAERERAWLAYLAPHFERFGSAVPEKLEVLYKGFGESEEMLAVFLDLKPAVVSFHFGLPSLEIVRALQDAEIRLVGSATNVREAEEIAAAGLDAIVAQGIEAGGHRGVFDVEARDERLTTVALTRLLVRQSSLPVIAAGGIMDGSGVAAALALGAEAAQLGTAFVACAESNADAAYREALRTGGSRGTVMTRAISGREARGLVNEFTRLGEDATAPETPGYPITYSAGKALHAAAMRKGSAAYAAHWAGQGVGMIREMGAAELVKTLAEEVMTAEGLARA